MRRLNHKKLDMKTLKSINPVKALMITFVVVISLGVIASLVAKFVYHING